MPGFLTEYRGSKAILDEAIAGCSWLAPRKEAEGSTLLAPYFWSCIFKGESAGIPYPVFKAALRQANAPFGTGFLQVPAYLYQIFRGPNAYGNKGCPYNCHLYDGKVECNEGLGPVAEDIIPRIVHTNNMVTVDRATQAAQWLKEAIRLAESGNVPPLIYTDLDFRVLNTVKSLGPLEPNEVIRIFDDNKWEHLDEHGMFTIRENLPRAPSGSRIPPSWGAARRWRWWACRPRSTTTWGSRAWRSAWTRR